MAAFHPSLVVRSAVLATSLTLVTGMLGMLPPIAAADAPDLTQMATLNVPPGPDQLEDLSAVTSDGTFIYAIDSNRIVKIRLSTMRRVATYAIPNGVHLTDDRFLHEPDIAVTNGMLFVSDMLRIYRLSTALDGSGWKVYGAYGEGRGEFRGIGGIAADKGMLYVVDELNYRVVRLSAKLDGSGWKTYGSRGAGKGQFSWPQRIAVAGGFVYVTDAAVGSTRPDRIVRFRDALDGTGWAAFHKPGKSRGQVNYAAAIAADATSIYIADPSIHGVVRMSSKLDGSGWASVGSLGPGVGHFGSPLGIAVAGTSVVVADDAEMGAGFSALDYGYPRVVRLPTTLSAKGWKTYAGSLPWVKPGQFGWAEGVATDGQFVYVADTMGNQIEKLQASDLAPVAHFGTIGRGVGQFNSPEGITVDGSDLYVVDSRNDRVVRLSTTLDGSGWVTFGTTGSAEGQLDWPDQVAVADGAVYVTDSGNHRIVRFSSALDGTGWATFGSEGSGDGQFDNPQGIVVDGTSILVADQGDNRVVRLSTALDGSGWTAVAPEGLDNGEFIEPFGIAIMGDHVVVSNYIELKLLRRSDLAFESGTFTDGNPLGIAATSDTVFAAVGQSVTAWKLSAPPATVR